MQYTVYRTPCTTKYNNAHRSVHLLGINKHGSVTDHDVKRRQKKQWVFLAQKETNQALQSK